MDNLARQVVLVSLDQFIDTNKKAIFEAPGERPSGELPFHFKDDGTLDEPRFSLEQWRGKGYLLETTYAPGSEPNLHGIGIGIILNEDKTSAGYCLINFEWGTGNRSCYLLQRTL